MIQETKESISRNIEATMSDEADNDDDIDEQSCNEGIDDANDSRNLNMQASKLRLTRRIMSSKQTSEGYQNLGIFVSHQSRQAEQQASYQSL